MGYISHIDGSYYEGDMQYGDTVGVRPPPTSQQVSSDNYKAMVRRRAKLLTPINAVLLLKTIGE